MVVYDRVDAIRERAARLDPYKAFLTLVLLPFFVIGYAGRLLWIVASLSVAGVQEGWSTSARHLAERGARASRGG